MGQIQSKSKGISVRALGDLKIEAAAKMLK